MWSTWISHRLLLIRAYAASSKAELRGGQHPSPRGSGSTFRVASRRDASICSDADTVGGNMMIAPLSPALGVEVTGLDVAESMQVEILDELRQLLNRHGLLLFRAQTLTPEGQVCLAGEFGPIAPNGDGSLFKHVANNPTEGAIDFISESRLLMHSDLQFAPLPLLGLSLYGKSIGVGAPPTLFANAARAYGKLAPATKSRIASLMVLQAAD